MKNTEIKINIGKGPEIVDKQLYIKAKHKTLVDFGYKSLTIAAVKEQLENVLNDKKLDVIGEFIKRDVIK
jgi:hypothetical protein